MFRRCYLNFLTAVLLTGSLLCPTCASADVWIDSVQIGLDGMARPGAWTRARVSVGSSSADKCQLLLQTADPSGNEVTFPSEEFEIESDQTRVVDIFFKPGRLETSLRVELIGADVRDGTPPKIVMSESDETADFRTLQSSVPAWIVVGRLPGSPGLAANPDRDALAKLRSRGVHLTEMATPEALPLESITLSAWGAVILSGEFGVSPEQSDALKSWVGNGGHLVLAVGTKAEELEASPLAEWALTGQAIRTSTISDLSGLEVLVSSFSDQQGGSIPLEDRRIPFFNPRQGVTIDSTDGAILARGLDGAVVTRHSSGFGRVTVLGVDLDQPPLARWRGLDSFLTTIVDVPVQTATRNSKATRISHSGITELATQLQTGMEQFDAVGARSTLTILGFTLLYLLVIGPLDWLVVHRVLKRPGLTWFTFPGVILLAVFLAGTSAQSSNGTDLRVNTLEIVDIDSVSGHGRQHVWTSIFSPSNRRAAVTLMPSNSLGQSEPLWLSWSGIPEAYFGGMYRGAGLEYGRPAYTMLQPESEQSGIENLPIPIWSDQVLAAETEFTPTADLFSSDLKRGGSGRLTPDSSFSHQLPVPIQEWLLVDSSHIYYHRLQSGDLMESGSLEAGVKWTPENSNVGVQALRSFLTGTRFQAVKQPKNAIGEEFVTTQADWDSGNTDISTIVRMLTLHDRAGGAEYTGLTNSVMSHLELSDCLDLDRVILIGRIDLACSGAQLDGELVAEDRRDTFIRVLLPVQKGEIGVLPNFDPNAR